MKRWIALLAALLLMLFVAMPTMACPSRHFSRFTVERHDGRQHHIAWRSSHAYHGLSVAADNSDKIGDNTQLGTDPSPSVGGGNQK